MTLPESFASDGFAVVGGRFEPEECSRLATVLSNVQESPSRWFKGHSVTSRAFYDVVVDHRLVCLARDALGTDDVLAWGASLVVRRPGDPHRWHSDVESWTPGARTVSIWVGLSNTTTNTSLAVVPGSHRIGSPIQELQARDDVDQLDLDDALIERWADAAGIAGGVVPVDVSNGDIIVFDGHLWHRSGPLDAGAARTAVLVQYTAGDAPVRAPVGPNEWDWPFEHADEPLPCVRVSGLATASGSTANLVVTPPPNYGATENERLSPTAVSVPIPFADPADTWTSRPALRGATHHLSDLSVHLSALSKGTCPHHPHQHPEEELLLILQGEAELTLPDLDGPARTQRVGPGDFVYYPAGFWHTLTGVSDDPVHYLMVKWFGDPTHARPPLGHVRHSVQAEHHSIDGHQGFHAGLVFDQPTGILDMLHCHTSVLDPGASFPEHHDDYDALMILLEGELETMGRRVSPVGVIYFAAGIDHFHRNPGSTPAKYLVLEFHGSWTAKQRVTRPAHRRPIPELLPISTDRPAGTKRLTGAIRKLRGLTYKSEVAAALAEENRTLLHEVIVRLDELDRRRQEQ